MNPIRRFFRFLYKISQPVYLPLGWTLLTIALLCLPGNTLPGTGLFGIKHIDKIAHFILFGGIVLFWTLRAAGRSPETDRWRKTLILMVLFSIGLGVIMEFVQVNYIPNRSFDNWDIVWDGIGSVTVAGILLWKGKSWGLL